MPALADFQTALGSAFEVSVAGQDAVTVSLVEVKVSDPIPGWEAFSLLFAGPVATLPQATYDVSHPLLESFPLFLVPVVVAGSPDPHLEAVFNRPLRPTTPKGEPDVRTVPR